MTFVKGIGSFDSLDLFWYNNNEESKINFIDKRIELFDRELLEASNKINNLKNFKFWEKFFIIW